MARFNLLASDIIDLELKLDGKLPINRDELLALVNSYGRDNCFYTEDQNNNEILIDDCKAKEKYDLSKLDVSQIKDFNKIFLYSYFNGDINSWDISNATSLAFMFAYTEEFNSPLYKWNTSNVTSINGMFLFAEKFNQNLNLWNISQVTNMDYMFESAKVFNQPILWNLSSIKSCYDMFLEAKSFLDKFNKGNELPLDTNDIKYWLNENKNKMMAFDIEYSKGKELDNFLEKFNVIDSTNLNGLHNSKGIDNGNV